ncbi:Putative transcriptional regulator YwtF [Nocardioides dokdonensis FR1436]|uniref:Putative transcriptional regulator YwtF n=1 Tax=Nocardioides dokdonensis FR1436 TaxID=1300347 RepID=A0A1A9GS82_9ACTN|nr:LCP family protein [Nocardioides dokdonensis]ANH40345.1 Putative transcriptional regulator YwtF [Nocardioides dokdonensis FR1436]
MSSQIPRRRSSPVRRAGVLGAILGATALVVPTAQVAPDDVALVRMQRSSAVDAHQHVIWILAVGSDARPGQSMTRSRGDALQMVGLDTRTGAAAAIGIPRDSFVPIPGYSANRVNAAMVLGGPQLLGRTVAGMVGVEPDYVMVTRFPFFEDLVDDIGGITVTNPRAFSDVNLKPEGFKRGRIRLDGYGAMAFSRIRKSLAGGDFARSANQQRVLRAIGAEIRARADRPGFMERGVLSVVQHMATDLGPAELFRVAQAMAQVEPSRITMCVVGGSVATIRGMSVVRPNLTQARRLGAAARDDATLPAGC